MADSLHSNGCQQTAAFLKLTSSINGIHPRFLNNGALLALVKAPKMIRAARFWNLKMRSRFSLDVLDQTLLPYIMIDLTVAL